MMKIALVLFVVLITVGYYGSGQGSHFREYELRTCLTDCYLTYSPNKNPGEFYSCVLRCKREYEERGDNHDMGLESNSDR